MVSPGAKLRPGRRVTIGERSLRRHPRDDRARNPIRQAGDHHGCDQAIARHGHVPLPPYITRADDAADAERYQTVYAREPGSVAAPTAGLHFTPGSPPSAWRYAAPPGRGRPSRRRRHLQADRGRGSSPLTSCTRSRSRSAPTPRRQSMRRGVGVAPCGPSEPRAYGRWKASSMTRGDSSHGGRDDDLHPPAIPVSRRRPPHHQLSSPPIDVADARRGIRRL